MWVLGVSTDPFRCCLLREHWSSKKKKMASSTDIGELRKLRVVDLREKLSKLRLPTGGRRLF